MSMIDELIAVLCPEGVPIKALKKVCLDFIVPMRDRPSDLTGAIPWCRIEDVMGQTIGSSKAGLGVSPATIKEMNLKVYPIGTVLATCSASLGTYAITSAPLITNQTFIGLVCGDELFNRFLLYVLEISTARLAKVSNSGTIPYISRKKFEEFLIPVPPLEVQREIVSILDKFTQLEAALEAELEAELEARKSQYEHTRDQLLDFSEDLSSHPLRELLAELCPDGVAVSKLDDLGVLYSGLSGKSKSDFTDGNAPFVSYLDIGNNSSLPTLIKSRVNVSPEERQNEIQFGDLLFTGSSEDRDGVGLTSEVEYSPGSKTYLNSFCFGFRPNDDLFVKGYLKHLFRSREVRIAVIACSNGVTRINISKKSLVKTEIPIPPLEIQREIVSILDKLDALVNDLTFGLPAEISARRKQYEYYRNQLLTFKELETA